MSVGGFEVYLLLGGRFIKGDHRAIYTGWEWFGFVGDLGRHDRE
jgi:hypothetical protein